MNIVLSEGTHMRLAWIALFLWPLLCTAQTARRDSVRQRMHERMYQIDSVLAEKRNRGNYDTAYIARPQARLTMKIRSNVSGTAFHVKGEMADYKVRSNLNTDYKATVSIGANYRGISAGLALNPASLSGRNSDYELNLNSYSNRYGFDVVFQSSRTLSGHVTTNGKDYFADKDVMDMRMLAVNGYYAFNGRRFSYPAAFSQSYMQKRSAGSWLLGFSYQGGTLKAGKHKPESLPDFSIGVGHLGIGGGYGYNLVLGHRWLVHLSALPVLSIFNRNNVKVDGQRQDLNNKFTDLMLTERAAIVRNMGEKYFACATLVMNNSLLGDGDGYINYRKWRVRLAFGIRL